MKKLLAFLMAAVMLIVFVACNKTDSTEPPIDTTETTAEPTPTTGTTEPAQTTAATETTPEVTTPQETTTETPVEPPKTAALPEAYVDIDFADGKVTDAKGHVTVENKGATIGTATVTVGDKTTTAPALQVTASGQYVLCTFNEITTKEDLEDWAQNSFSVEAFYVMGSKGSIQGVVCGTEKGGWGLAESKDGKPYFITAYDNNKYNDGAYAKTASSTTKLVHVVAVYDRSNGRNLIYINGELNASTPIQNLLYPGDGDYAFNRFCLGADIKATAGGLDYPSPNMTMVDAKIYSEALTAEQAMIAYENAINSLN